MKQIRVSVWGFILGAILLSGSGCHKKQEGQVVNAPAGASNQGSTITLSTMNCYWFLGEEDYRAADKPRTTEDYNLKAGHLIGLLPADAPLLAALVESGSGAMVDREAIHSLNASRIAGWSNVFNASV